MGNGHPQGNAKIYSQKPKRTSSIYNLHKTEIRRDSRFQLKKQVTRTQEVRDFFVKYNLQGGVDYFV